MSSSWPDIPGPIVPEQIVIADRRARGAELAAERARARVEAAEALAAARGERVRELEHALESMKLEPERLRRELAEQEQIGQRIEQRLHSEHALRDELEHEIDDLNWLLERERRRVRTSEEEVDALRRSVDEADHAAAVARAAQRRAERGLAEQLTTSRLLTRLRAEQALARGAPAAQLDRGPSVAPEPSAAAEPAAAHARQPSPTSALLALERKLRAQHRKLGPQRPPTRPALARIPNSGPTTTATDGGVDTERLSAALSRLREAARADERRVAARPPAAPQSPAPWLPRGIRKLAALDPHTAGRLIIELLPAQHLAHPDPLAYELHVTDAGCVAVTVEDGITHVGIRRPGGPPTPPTFVVEGDLPGLARMLTRGRFRRMLTRRTARISGPRRAAAPLRALVRTALSLEQLLDAGVHPDPELALHVVALVIDPAWTARERFVIGHEAGPGPRHRAYLQVRDGQPLAVLSEPPLGPVATTIRCTPDELLHVLAGGHGRAAEIRGDERPLALLAQWIERGQNPRAKR